MRRVSINWLQRFEAKGMSEIDEVKKSKWSPVGNLSIKTGEGWKQVAGCWFVKGKYGGYLLMKAKESFTVPEGSNLTLHLNASEFRIAFIRRTAIIM